MPELDFRLEGAELERFAAAPLIRLRLTNAEPALLFSGTVVLVLIVLAIWANAKDIMRYYRIRNM